MKITSTLGIDFHARVLRGVRDGAKRAFAHAEPADAPVRADRSFWEKVRCFEIVDPRRVTRHLHDAIDAGDAGRVRRLLRHGLVDPNAGFAGWSPVRRAVEKGNPEALAALLRTPGFDPAEVDDFGSTALTHAIAANEPACVEMLLADPRTDLRGAAEMARRADDASITARLHACLQDLQDLTNAHRDGNPDALLERWHLETDPAAKKRMKVSLERFRLALQRKSAADMGA